MSQTAVAAYLGVSLRTYCSWEKGDVVPLDVTQEGVRGRLDGDVSGFSARLQCLRRELAGALERVDALCRLAENGDRSGRIG